MQRFCLCIWNADKPWDKRLEDIGAVFPDILVYWGSRPSDSIIEEAGIIYLHDFFFWVTHDITEQIFCIFLEYQAHFSNILDGWE